MIKKFQKYFANLLICKTILKYLKIALMQVFLYAIVFTTKPHFGVKRMYCIEVRLGGYDNTQ